MSKIIDLSKFKDEKDRKPKSLATLIKIAAKKRASISSVIKSLDDGLE